MNFHKIIKKKIKKKKIKNKNKNKKNPNLINNKIIKNPESKKNKLIIGSINLTNNSNSKSISKLPLKNSIQLINSKKKLYINNIKEKQKINTYKKYTDFELNTFQYKNALKYDKRNYCTYYISLIRTKHPILFSFIPIKDYNSMIIKMDLFILSFSIYYFINGLFFDEQVIHQIYEDQGIYNFIYLIPFILYSFVISHTLTIILNYFSLSQKNICEIKNEKTISKANDKAYKVKKCLVIKYICFYIIGSIFLLFLWYYLSSFGAVYQNTQVYLIKNTLISFGFSLIYPFVINLFASILRIYSLKESNRKCFFKISKIIQFL